MSPYSFPLALFAFFGFVAIIPVWMWFLNDRLPGLPLEFQFIAGLVLPAMLLVFLGSWMQPGGA